MSMKSTTGKTYRFGQVVVTHWGEEAGSEVQISTMDETIFLSSKRFDDLQTILVDMAYDRAKEKMKEPIKDLYPNPMPIVPIG